MSGDFHIVSDQILVFTLDGQFYAISLSGVARIIHAIEIKHLPRAPEIIMGIINVNGRIIPVADFRKRFDLPFKEVNPDNQIIIVNTGKRVVAIPVDSVVGIKDLIPGQMKPATETVPFAEMLTGVAKVDDNLVLIYDLEGFMSLNEESILDNAMSTGLNEL